MSVSASTLPFHAPAARRMESELVGETVFDIVMITSSPSRNGTGSNKSRLLPRTRARARKPRLFGAVFRSFTALAIKLNRTSLNNSEQSSFAARHFER
jgi:hypothetical protein